jgi:hypothetical protein
VYDSGYQQPLESNMDQDIIVTEDIHAPWTWYIATYGDYDLDCHYGSGRTPLDAIVDLLDQTEGL